MAVSSGKKIQIITVLFLLIIIMALLTSIIVGMQKESRSVEISVVEINGLPCRIVFFSDPHSTINNVEFLKTSTSLINSQEPDIVLIGGDFIHSRYGEIFLQDYLSKINAPKYGVFGNHDYYAGYDKEIPHTENSTYRFSEKKDNMNYIAGLLSTELEKQGVKILRNENRIIKINDSEIVIFGLDYENPPEKINLTYKSPCFRILLMHEPLYNINSDYDLLLAGHTHGGQIVIPYIGAPLELFGRDCFSGKIENSNNTIYITRGLGSFPLSGFLELRYNCPPEIVVFKPAESV